MKSTTVKLACAMAIATVVAATIGSPAHADLNDCPSGNVCIWVDGPFVGAPTTYGAPNFRNLNAGDLDQVSSWANKTSSTYCLYDNGSSNVLDVLGREESRGAMRPGTNDKADAIGRCG
uniref:Peptidase inhibitor family I36 n=1 Tax=uncultured bacterium esnapd14 TaxID=1366594 RepID=S5UCT6_9BACT|nr:hypothetical protein [uncultured bacterium esnapd14]